MVLYWVKMVIIVLPERIHALRPLIAAQQAIAGHERPLKHAVFLDGRCPEMRATRPELAGGRPLLGRKYALIDINQAHEQHGDRIGLVVKRALGALLGFIGRIQAEARENGCGVPRLFGMERYQYGERTENQSGKRPRPAIFYSPGDYR